LGENRRFARGDDRQLTSRSPYRPAADPGIQIAQTAGLCPCRKVAGGMLAQGRITLPGAITAAAPP